MGASSGIGAETARVLALRGVHVVMGIRKMAAGKEVKDVIVKEIPTAKVDIMELDLSSLASVRKFASEFISKGHPLNILINNAGTTGTPLVLSEDDIELQFATNHLGHFLLTNLLLDTMKETSSRSGREGRIINVSSEGHRRTYDGGIRFEKINDPSGHSGFYSYGQSKLANILHANELARHLKEDGVEITANSVHPGPVVTNIVRQLSIFRNMNSVLKVCSAFAGIWVIKNVQQGAATTCYVALHPEVKGKSGLYFKDSNICQPSSQALDTELARKLWNFSLSLSQKSSQNQNMIS